MKYYTFEIDGKKVGFYEERDEDGVLYSCAKFVIDGHTLENPFWIKYSDAGIEAYKFGDCDYIPFEEDEDVYPSSAIALLIPKVEEAKPFKFRPFHEGEGKVEGRGILELSDDKIKEKINGKLNRYFVINGNETITCFWGGTAYSHKVSNREEAVKGTAWELNK